MTVAVEGRSAGRSQQYSLNTSGWRAAALKFNPTVAFSGQMLRDRQRWAGGANALSVDSDNLEPRSGAPQVHRHRIRAGPCRVGGASDRCRQVFCCAGRWR